MRDKNYRIGGKFMRLHSAGRIAGLRKSIGNVERRHSWQCSRGPNFRDVLRVAVNQRRPGLQPKNEETTDFTDETDTKVVPCHPCYPWSFSLDSEFGFTQRASKTTDSRTREFVWTKIHTTLVADT